MLKKRLALNFGANLFVQFVNILVQIGSVPLFLAFWSEERYGAWILISSIPSCLNIGEAGFATTSANEVSMAIALGDRERALRSLHTAWGFLLTISSVLATGAVLSVFLIPWERLQKFSEVTVDEARWTVFLFILFTIAGILIAIFRGIYRAAYKYPRFTVMMTCGSLAEAAGMALGVIFTNSMVCVVALMLMMRLFLFAALFLDSLNFSFYLRLGLSAFSFAELRRSWRPSAMFMGGTLASAIYFQGSILLVGASLGPSAVVVFNTTRTISRVIVQFVTMIQSSVWPEFSYLFGAGDLIRARRLNELSIEISWLASLVLATVIFFAAPFIMPLWTHHTVQLDRSLLAIFLMSAMLNGFWFVTSGLLMGTNQHEGLIVRQVVAAAIAVMIGALSVHVLGLYGIGLGMIVCELVILPYSFSRTCHLLQQPVNELIFGAMQLSMVRQTSAAFYHRWFAR